MTIENEIKSEISKFRDLGVTDELFVVPIVHKRCFVSCKTGTCNCFATIGKRFCVVTKESKVNALNDANEELQFLNNTIYKLSQ